MKRAFVLVLATLLSACAGGTFGNLIPLPKILDGDIENSVYTSPRKFFSVMTPFPEGSYPYTYMEVSEGKIGMTENVMFSSSTHPGKWYSVEVTLAVEGDDVKDTDHYINESGKFLEEKYTSAGATNFKLVSAGQVETGIGEARFTIHGFTVPSRFSLLNLSSSAPQYVRQLTVAYASPDGLVFQSFGFTGACEPCAAGDIGGVRALHEDIDRMLDSISVDRDAR